MTFPEPIPIHSYCIPHFEGQGDRRTLYVQPTICSHGGQKLIAPVAANQNPLRIKEKIRRHLPCWFGSMDIDPSMNTDDNPLIGDTWLGDLGVDATVAPKRPGVKSP
ncbi:hypothetical protein T06_9817 [Trichinella sp. T6]|nr:hypothetical protein T06_9817 [Trichinella sp. T6]